MKQMIWLLFLLAMVFGLAAQSECQWAVECGGMGCNEPMGIDTDMWGSIYITGFFEDTATFGPFTLTATPSVAGGANRDVFVAKLSPQGQFLWVARSVGTFNNVPEGLATDALGNTYITGFYQGTVSFGDYFLPKFAPGNYIDGDMFVAKLDTNGNWLWAKAVGSTYFERPYDLSIDDAGNLYVCGTFSNSTSFDDILISGESSQGFFIAKADRNGIWQWVRYGGGMGEDRASSLTVDAWGNVFVAGAYEFETQIGNWTFPGEANYDDAWFAKLDTNGNWLWANAYRSPGSEYASDVAADAEGNCFMSCSVDDSLTINGVTYTPVGRSLYLYIKHDPNGQILNVSPCGSAHPNYYLLMPSDVTCDGSNLYTFGDFHGPAYWGSIELTTPVSNPGFNVANKYIALLSGEGDWMQAFAYQVNDPITSGNICLDGNQGLILATSFSDSASFGDYAFTSQDGIDNIIIAKYAAITDNQDELAPPMASGQITAYPNPFREVVTIEIPNTGKQAARMSVFDLKGRKIRELALFESGAESLSGSWNGRDEMGKPCASGIYFLRIDGDGKQHYTRRVVLAK